MSAAGIALAILSRMDVQQELGTAQLLSSADLWPTILVLATVSLGSSMLLWGAAREARQDLPSGILAALLVLLSAYILPILGYWLLYLALRSRTVVALRGLGYAGPPSPEAIDSWLPSHTAQREEYDRPRLAMAVRPDDDKITLDQAMKKVGAFKAWVQALDAHLEAIGDTRRHGDWEDQQLAYGFLEKLAPVKFLETPSSRRRRLSTVLRT